MAKPSKSSQMKMETLLYACKTIPKPFLMGPLLLRLNLGTDVHADWQSGWQSGVPVMALLTMPSHIARYYFTTMETSQISTDSFQNCTNGAKYWRLLHCGNFGLRLTHWRRKYPLVDLQGPLLPLHSMILWLFLLAPKPRYYLPVSKSCL